MKKQLALAHARVLGRDGLFYFYDHFALRPDLVGRFQNGGAGPLVKAVRESGALAGVAFNHHLVAGIGQRAHSGRRQADTILVVFDLFGQSDNHSFAPTGASC